MTFEEYLIGKKIDLESFQQKEPILFKNWKTEFSQMHPNSFSAQKLYLINPIRRKYPLKNVRIIPEKKAEENSAKTDVAVTVSNALAETESPKTEPPVSKPARPVFKPKPKIG